MKRPGIDLDDRQRRLLRRLADATYTQDKGGYYCPGQPKIQRKTVAPLLAHGLARLDHSRRGRPAVLVTDHGLEEIDRD